MARHDAAPVIALELHMRYATLPRLYRRHERRVVIMRRH